jgi:hypothetical protein
MQTRKPRTCKPRRIHAAKAFIAVAIYSRYDKLSTKVIDAASEKKETALNDQRPERVTAKASLGGASTPPGSSHFNALEQFS